LGQLIAGRRCEEEAELMIGAIGPSEKKYLVKLAAETTIAPSHADHFRVIIDPSAATGE